MGNFWSDPSAVQIQTATQSGGSPVSYTVTLPRSDNQKEGAVFSFEGWFVVNDYTGNGYGSRRMIFSRADCPGLYIDSTSNSILVVVDTYGAPETIMIQNIPAQKWIHFAIVVSQYAVDVYINGILRQHHTLTQLPKQEDAPVRVAQKPFDGQVGGLTYYARALTALEVSTHSSTAPPPSLVTVPPSGHYFDISWYTGR